MTLLEAVAGNCKGEGEGCGRGEQSWCQGEQIERKTAAGTVSALSVYFWLPADIFVSGKSFRPGGRAGAGAAGRSTGTACCSLNAAAAQAAAG